MHRGKISKIFINQRKGRIMEKILRKGFISLLSLLMVFTTFNQLITNVAAEQEYENIALDKVVVASSAIAGNEGSNAVDGKIVQDCQRIQKTQGNSTFLGSFLFVKI